MFAIPGADNLSALGPNGSGRGPTRPNYAEASNVTQTANTAQSANQNIVEWASPPCSAESVGKAATISSNGVANN